MSSSARWQTPTSSAEIATMRAVHGARDVAAERLALAAGHARRGPRRVDQRDVLELEVGRVGDPAPLPFSTITTTSAPGAAGQQVARAQRAGQLAAGQARQPLLLLLVRARVLDQRGRQRRRQERHRRDACARAPRPAGSPARSRRGPGRRAPRRSRCPASRARTARSTARRRCVRASACSRTRSGLARSASSSRAVRWMSLWSSVSPKSMATPPPSVGGGRARARRRCS